MSIGVKSFLKTLASVATDVLRCTAEFFSKQPVQVGLDPYKRKQIDRRSRQLVVIRCDLSIFFAFEGEVVVIGKSRSVLFLLSTTCSPHRLFDR